jgi:trk system potassium uptake protein TrkH
MKHPWKQIGFATKIALYFSIGLILFGALGHLWLEQDHTQRGMDWTARITTAFFMSINRTAGFSTIDFAMASAPMVLITIFLMFVGSSSSSTGGGIKTSTLAVVLADLWRTIKGFDHVQLFQRTIPEIIRSRAYSVLLFFLGWNMFTVFVLSVSESEILAAPGRGVIDLMFESVSAMSTVGLSTGITAALSPVGKVAIILNMFIGRVGALTVILAIGGKVTQSHIKYPEAQTMIG